MTQGNKKNVDKIRQRVEEYLENAFNKKDSDDEEQAEESEWLSSIN